jgi:esterase/lipase
MRRAAAAPIVAMLVAACAGGEGPSPGSTVRFDTDDGIELTGEFRGSGGVGVVLAHAFPADRASWADFADFLEGKGYLTLTFDFRGYGDSAGDRDIPEIWRDVLAAASRLRARGAESIVLVGASMGGTASLIAASRTDVNAIDEPKLFLAAEGDESAPESALALYERSSGAKRVEIVNGESHGTELLEGGQAEVVRNIILQFLSANT